MPSELDVLAERYALEAPLARGGMGVVWRAIDEVLARPVAVKLLHPHLSEDREFLDRFRFEALAAARLTHPGIVAIFDSGTIQTGPHEPDQHYIVMEYCGGGTLADVLAAEGRLDPPRVAALGSQICEALGYAHSLGIVHRDVKPANLLLTDDGTLKVGDFGIAKAAFRSGDITTTGAILGTVTYLSPEQATGGEPGPASDLYGVGVVLYELLVGRPPFVGETQLAIAMKHLNDEPPPPRTIRADVPRALEEAILKALRKEPTDRFGSAEEMARVLEAAAGASGAAGEAAPAGRTDRRHAPRPVRPRDTRWVVPVGLLLLAAVVIAVVAAMFTDDEAALPGGRPTVGETASEDPTRIQPAEALDFDPHGTAGEHPLEVPLAFDGDPATAWTTEEYGSALQTQKTGVGLIFDLGESRSVQRLVIDTTTAGLDVEIRAGDEDAPQDETDFDLVDEAADIEAQHEFALEESEARFWLLWITSLPGDGAGSGAVSEVRFFGS